MAFQFSFKMLDLRTPTNYAANPVRDQELREEERTILTSRGATITTDDKAFGGMLSIPLISGELPINVPILWRFRQDPPDVLFHLLTLKDSFHVPIDDERRTWRHFRITLEPGEVYPIWNSPLYFKMHIREI